MAVTDKIAAREEAEIAARQPMELSAAERFVISAMRACPEPDRERACKALAEFIVWFSHGLTAAKRGASHV